MKLDIVLRIFALIMAVLLPISAAQGTVIGATPGEPITAERTDYSFDNERLLIGGYNVAHRDETHVQYAADAGFDFFITAVDENFLSLCDQYGLGVIAKGYGLPAYYGSLTAAPEWMAITEQSYNYTHPCVWGNDLIDEPNASVFPLLGQITEHYYANTTGKLPLINLFPMYANSEQLGNNPEIHASIGLLYASRDLANESVDRYKRHVSDYINQIGTDYISVDIYPLKVSSDGVKQTNALWLRNLDILSEACRETNRDLWVITQSSGNTETEEGGSMRHCDTPEDIRWQSFVTLSFGAKAIIHACYDGGWWDSSSHLIDENGERTATYYAVQTVNGELKSFANIYGGYSHLGAFLMNKIGVAGTLPDAYLTPVDSSAKPRISSTSPLLVGCFEKKDGSGIRAFTVVNMNEPSSGKSATATLSVDEDQMVTVYQLGKATTFNSTDSVKLTLQNGEGVFITMG